MIDLIIDQIMTQFEIILTSITVVFIYKCLTEKKIDSLSFRISAIRQCREYFKNK